MPARKRVSVLASGGGSNLGSLIKASHEASFPARIVGVLSDHRASGALERAEKAGIEWRAVPRRPGMAKEEHESGVTQALEEWDTEIVCLAGYMRLLSPAFVARWRGKLLNIHPSLLPAFPGLDTHERALKRGVRLHGCTVHFVDEGMDEGPIIEQAAVPVEADDDSRTLAARVLEREHDVYPRVLADVASGRVWLGADGRVTRRK